VDVRAHDVVWRGGDGPVRVTARVRYRGAEGHGIAQRSPEGLTVRLDEPVEAPAPGQALVCYDGDTVLGGGVIGEWP
jgi:tRNA-specific 2-thiouridylase